MRDRALAKLKEIWGFAAFRGQQLEIVAHVAAGGNAFVLMPTGGGKSLCYQVPGLLRPGLTVVISPLIALMQDQVQALTDRKICAALLNSTLDAEQTRQVERQARDGTLKFLYIAPERLLAARTLSLLAECDIGLFAIDEAHCVSQWGHDFRPEYRRLGVIAERWPAVPRIALTASADLNSRADIEETLQLRDAPLFLGSFDRTNIFYRVVPKVDAERQLLDYVSAHANECGVVYALSRRKVEQLAALLQAHGYCTGVYHAGLQDAVRAANQQAFLASQRMIMCATIAFGMGIDKPNVRFVAHVDLPKSMEGYYQETGRGGRDGKPAEAWLCYSPGDRLRLRKMIAAGDTAPPRKRMELHKLDALLGYCESKACRHQTLVGWFDESHPGHCGMCDNCTALPPTPFNGHRLGLLALSAVARLGAECTHQIVLDTLLGRATAGVIARDGGTLSVYGRGAVLGLRGWQAVVRQLYGLGYLELDPHQVSALRLSRKAVDALRSRAVIPIHCDALPFNLPQDLIMDPHTENPKPAREPYRPIDLSDLDPAAAARFQALKQWRAATAKAAEVPAYIVMHDATLKCIAELNPQVVGDLVAVPGIGTAKLERYGDAVIALLSPKRRTADF